MDNQPQTTLLLVRHGQSTWNALKQWQGQADPPLSDHGRQQAQQAATVIGAVDAIASSPQIRALETATIISEIIGVGPVQTVDGLRERVVGEWSGLTTSDVESQFPGWLDAGRRPPGWEHDDSFQPRVLEALDHIMTTIAGATALVVCHGGVIHCLEDLFEIREGRTPNLHGRVFTGVPGNIWPGERLSLTPDDMTTGGTSSASRL